MEAIICRVVAQEVSHLDNNELMDRTERFYKIDALLQANRFVPIDRMLREL